MIPTILSELKKAADPLRKDASKRMFPTTMEYLGVRTPKMRELINRCWQEIKSWPPEKLIRFSKELVETKIFEANQLAFELLWKNKDALNQLRIDDLNQLGNNMDNWATTDTFCISLSGWAWRNQQISDDDILCWLESGNRWWRRAAVVSTVPLNRPARGGTGDTKRTLMICEKVIHDHDDMIVKALSWALRELSKTDRNAVQEFLNTYDFMLAGRVRREVWMKLKTGKKNG